MNRRKFYILNDDGSINHSIEARRKKIVHGNTHDYWQLEDLVDTHMTMSYPIKTEIVDSAGWVNPSEPFTDKVMEGCEEEFDFFLEHGYHNPRHPHVKVDRL